MSPSLPKPSEVSFLSDIAAYALDEYELSQEEIHEIINISQEIRTGVEESWVPPHPSSDSRVWRYINFTEFMSILERGKLWFSNIRKFNDPYEGSIPQRNIQREIQEISEEADIELDLAKRFHSVVTGQAFPSTGGLVNCWNISEHESAALWEQYIDSSEGVAIATSVERLERAFHPEELDLTFGKIEYIDYEKESIPRGKLPALYHKRKSFEHEKEFRVSIVHERDDRISESGRYMEVDLDILLDEVYLSPTAAEWFYDQVERVLDTYDVNCSLIKSDIYSDPVY